MNIELINTGSELMLGHVLNTHQQWICRQLADHGYRVTRQVTVADAGPDIQQAVREALARADLVITTGGLGPTSDDLTRDLIADLLGKELREDAAVLANLENFFTLRKRPMPEKTRVQALVPEGAIVLHNPHGTAPGLAIEIQPNPSLHSGKTSWLIMLPGPPRELRPMFNEQVLPLIRERFPLLNAFVSRTLKTTGLGESFVEEKVAGPLQQLTDAGLEIGYCARTGEVDLRLSARGAGAGKIMAEAEQIVDAIAKHGGIAIYVLYPDEGHGFARPANRLDFIARTEKFLADNLHGRYEPMPADQIPGSTAKVRVVVPH